MTKVCHFSSAHPNDDPRILYKECTSLAKAGYEVYFVTQGKDAVVNGVNLVGAGDFAGQGFAGKLKRMFSYSKKVFTKAVELDCDIYHFHDPELMQYAGPLKKMGKRVIFDCHEDYVTDLTSGSRKAIPGPLNGVAAKLYSRAEKKVALTVDAVITVNETLVNKFEGFGVKTVQITNYPLFKTDDINSRNSSNDVFTLVFMGKQPENYMQNSIVEALSGLERVCYVIYGDTTEDFRQRLLELPGGENVRFAGRVPFSQSFNCLLNADAGIGLPVSENLRGSIGNTKAFEYMMAALPIIWSSSDTWDAVVNGAKCGFTVNPFDSREIRKAILALRDNPQDAVRMGENGRKAVEENFCWESQVPRLIDLYDELSN